MEKKAQIENLIPLVTSLIGIGIVIVIGFLIFAQTEDLVIEEQGADYCDGHPNLTFNVTGHNCYNISDAAHFIDANLTSAFNGTQDTKGAMSQIPGWLSIIIITAIGALLLGIVSYFRKS